MRPIKFRAWNKVHKVFVWFDTIIFDTDSNLWKLRGDTTYFLDEVELLQFTGLHDKNGKEIYEGDIVKHEDDRIGHIAYRNDIASFVYIEQEGGWDSIEVVKEIIGNIYENPELLEKSNDTSKSD